MPYLIGASQMRIRATLGAATVAALALTACASSGGNSAGGGASTSPAAPSPSPTFTGSPIVIGQIGDFTSSAVGNAEPVVKSAAQAAVDAINAAGGINGHELVLKACDAAGDPNKASGCARDLVKAGVVADVGDSEYFSDQFNPIFQSAGIQRIGEVPESSADYTAANSWPTQGGGAAMFIGGLLYAKKLGMSKVFVGVQDVPGATAQEAITEGAAKSIGMQAVGHAAIAESTADMSSYVAQATNGGADVVNLGIGPVLLQQFAQTSAQLGAKYKISAAAEAVSDDLAAKLGKTGGPLEGAVLASAYPPVSATTNPGIAQFTKEMNAAQAAGDKNAGPADRSIAISSWVAVHAFANLAKTITGDVTSASVLTALNTAKDIDLAGITSPWTPSSKKVGVFPAISNTEGYFITIKDGVKVLDGTDPVDLLTPLEQG
jgi:ABC-type branched-subunit amino acid transport system substrate-binding protein